VQDSLLRFRIGKRGLEPAQHLHPDLGNVGALAEITDRVEGRALQALRIAGDDGGPVPGADGNRDAKS